MPGSIDGPKQVRALQRPECGDSFGSHRLTDGQLAVAGTLEQSCEQSAGCDRGVVSRKRTEQVLSRRFGVRARCLPRPRAIGGSKKLLLDADQSP